MNRTAPLETSDAAERELSATTFDRNVVVTAGAGTGKTTLLVDRLVHLLMREPAPLEITEIVALTFTNKAANEMKLRLRERLEAYRAVALDSPPAAALAEAQAEVQAFIDRYRLSKDEIDRRAGEALRRIERSEIGTIHSFAASMLRLHPLEAGLDPRFREDDGAFFERHFEEQWSVWLDQELTRGSPRYDDWKEVLRRTDIAELRSLAAALCSETIPLDRFAAGTDAPAPAVSAWLEGLAREAAELLDRHPEDTTSLGAALRAAATLIGEMLRAGEIAPAAREKAAAELSRSINKPSRWLEADYRRARDLVRVARRLARVDRRSGRLVAGLLLPFASRCREAFVAKGFVSFDGLLARARDLLRDHAPIREELKRSFRALLIDEFQDTDPLQYEILLYLAEREGRNARHWRDVELEPGKLFIVGDPKQSIYAFRRADIEGYLEIVQKVIQAQGGVECRLTTNFRSPPPILDAVNGIFARLIQPRPGLQPEYVPIHPRAEGAAAPLPDRVAAFRGVTIRRVEGDGELDAAEGRRVEAESIARWIAEEILDRPLIWRHGEPVAARPGDIALLFRTLTHAHEYLEPLRRRGIPYVVEGEKHFYATQEVIDAVNLLRAIENPYDRSALVGVLRSALGGVEDRELYRLGRERLLNYRCVRGLDSRQRRSLGPLGELYEVLESLHARTRALPVGEAIELIFRALPVRLLAARSYNGPQAVANLEKVVELAEAISREGTVTLAETIARLERRVRQQKEESESALAEEGIDAVRVLSVHKAKGLEFPIVILPCARSRPDRGYPEVEAQHDWSTGLVGFKLGDLWTLPGVFLAEKREEREREEEKRVFYVAMTRARDRVTISFAASRNGGSGSFYSLLEQSAPEISSPAPPVSLPVGAGAIRIEVVREGLSPPRRKASRPRKTATQPDWSAYAAIWRRRSEFHRAASAEPLFVTPTALKRDAHRRPPPPAEGAPDPLLLGTLVHGFLQRWDFGCAPDLLEESLQEFSRPRLAALAPERRAAIEREAREVLTAFTASPAYAELASAEIVGREVPFLTPWDGQVMEGVIDLIYRRRGRIYLADYKTDRVAAGELEDAASAHRQQAAIYAAAASRALGRPIGGFKLIFVRAGQAIEMFPGETDPFSSSFA